MTGTQAFPLHQSLVCQDTSSTQEQVAPQSLEFLNFLCGADRLNFVHIDYRRNLCINCRIDSSTDTCLLFKDTQCLPSKHQPLRRQRRPQQKVWACARMVCQLLAPLNGSHAGNRNQYSSCYFRPTMDRPQEGVSPRRRPDFL